MKSFLSAAVLLLAMVADAFAGELPHFPSDQAADVWLRDKSPIYQKMAATMDQRGGYEIVRTAVYPRSMMVSDASPRPSIQLNDAMQGATRLTLMIFEFSNAFQVPQFKEIAASVQGGKIKDASEYAILHMLIEMESLQLHRRILADLDHATSGVPKEMFQCFRPEVATFAAYDLPTAYDYIQGRQGSDYRKYYEQWFKEHLQTPLGKAK